MAGLKFVRIEDFGCWCMDVSAIQGRRNSQKQVMRNNVLATSIESAFYDVSSEAFQKCAQ